MKALTVQCQMQNPQHFPMEIPYQTTKYVGCESVIVQLSLNLFESTGCPRKNVPLEEGQTSHKGTFFLGLGKKSTDKIRMDLTSP